VAALAAAAVPPAGGAAAPVPGYAGCRSFVASAPVALVRPRSIVFACADANFYAVRLRWTRWDANGARAAGVAYQNDCTPNCAAGHFHAYRLAVGLAGAAACGRSRPEFTRVSWSFLGRKPLGVPRTGSETFRCR
jgi:hypothetical protein